MGSRDVEGPWGATARWSSRVIVPEPLEVEIEFDAVQREIEEIRCQRYPPEIFAAAIAEDRRAESTEDDGEIAAFEPAPRITEDDISGNQRSLNRALDTRLYLVVKQRGAEVFDFPVGPVFVSETTREAVERVQG